MRSKFASIGNTVTRFRDGKGFFMFTYTKNSFTMVCGNIKNYVNIAVTSACGDYNSAISEVSPDYTGIGMNK